jgi:DnaK suppressor protein
MDHLTLEQQTELRAELERQLERLEKSMRLTDQAASPVELDQQAVGRLSRMDSLLSQGMAKKLKEREQAKLAALVTALRRMEEGRFGVCERCGGAVPYERLLVMPETPNCTACAG